MDFLSADDAGMQYLGDVYGQAERYSTMFSNKPGGSAIILIRMPVKHSQQFNFTKCGMSGEDWCIAGTVIPPELIYVQTEDTREIDPTLVLRKMVYPYARSTPQEVTFVPLTQWNSKGNGCPADR